MKSSLQDRLRPAKVPAVPGAKAGENNVSLTGASRTGGTRLRRLSGLDGLRALAVTAVLVYHANSNWLKGGFLGVEVFFVVSGYLITALLLAEWRERGGIDIVGFWLRRARRLLPAVFLMILVTLVFAVVFLPDEVAGLRWDALAAFGYVTNWYMISGQESYFEAVGRPSLLKHLWSLAVEEQFYLVWPLVAAGTLAVLGRRGLMFIALAGAVGSAAWMASLYTPDVDPSRLYYGTDTRAAGLLFGAVLACLWVPGKERERASETIQRRLSRRDWRKGKLRRKWGWTVPLLLDVAGIAALGSLVYCSFALDEYQPFLYQGGFAVVALVTVVLISALVHPKTHTGLMDLWVLRWIGVRSYGIYLWHWPIYTVTRPELDVPLDGPQLLALRLVATILVADLSYRFIETPIRRGSLGRKWRSWRAAPRYRRRRLNVSWAMVAVAVVAISAGLGTALVHAETPETPVYLAKKAIHTNLPGKNSSTREPSVRTVHQNQLSREQAVESAEKTTSSKPQKGLAAHDKADETEKPKKSVERASGVKVSNKPVGRVTAVGDSVMLGAADSLKKEVGNLEIMDAAVGLYPGDAVDILRSRKSTGELGDTVIIQVGENGPFSADQFDEMMDILGDRQVLFVNVKVPRTWEAPNNEVMSEGTRKYPNARLIDWHTVGSEHPELFWDDGIHLRPEGAKVYADLISGQLKQKA